MGTQAWLSPNWWNQVVDSLNDDGDESGSGFSGLKGESWHEKMQPSVYVAMVLDVDCGSWMIGLLMFSNVRGNFIHQKKRHREFRVAISISLITCEGNNIIKCPFYEFQGYLKVWIAIAIHFVACYEKNATICPCYESQKHHEKYYSLQGMKLWRRRSFFSVYLFNLLTNAYGLVIFFLEQVDVEGP